MSDSQQADTARSDDLILAGAFSDCSFDEMLGMVAISRQCMEVILAADGKRRGSLLIKGGQLLAARRLLPSPLDGVAAFRALRDEPGASFEIFQRPGVRWPAVTLGPLSQVLTSNQLPNPDSQLVMQGLLGPVSLDDLIEIAALSRQQLEIAIANSTGRLGSVTVRASYLLKASERGGADGAEALRRLRRASGEHFLVLRQPADLSLVPIATLSEVADDAGDAEEQAAQSLIMSGALSEISIRDVLGAFSLSRQLTELILSDASGVRGSLLIKGGQLLSARSMAHGNQGRQAFFALLREPGTSVAAHSREQAIRDIRPIGLLGELLAETQRAPVAHPEPVRAPLMEGNFVTMPLEALMMMVSRSRQVMEVSFRNGDKPLGSIVVKAGQLLQAHAGSATGLDAFRAIQADPGSGFQVFRSDAAAPGVSLGALSALLSPQGLPPAPSREVVLKGRLEDGDVADIFQILGISRMHLELRFRRNSQSAGIITMKAGQVLSASAGALSGSDAVNAILRLPQAEVSVYQTPAPEPLPAPIGLMVDYLQSHHLPVPEAPSAQAPAPAPAPEPAAARAQSQIEALQAQLQAQNTLIRQLSEKLQTPPPPPAAAPSSPDLLVLLQSLQQPAPGERALMWLVGTGQVVMIAMFAVLLVKVLA